MAGYQTKPVRTQTQTDHCSWVACTFGRSRNSSAPRLHTRKSSREYKSCTKLATIIYPILVVLRVPARPSLAASMLSAIYLLLNLYPASYKSCHIAQKSPGSGHCLSCRHIVDYISWHQKKLPKRSYPTLPKHHSLLYAIMSMQSAHMV